MKQRGDRKEGEQIQVIVSRKDAMNKVKLNPTNTSRETNTEHSKKMDQFDPVALSRVGRVFDSVSAFDRQLKDTLAYVMFSYSSGSNWACWPKVLRKIT